MINFSEVERCCIVGLGQCTDPKLLNQIYQYGATDGKIRGQDLIYLFMSAGMASISVCQHHAWNFFKQNMKMMLDKYGGTVNNNLFQHCLKASTKGFCSSAMANEVEGFCKENVDEHQLKVLNRPIRQIVESIELKERLLKSNVADLGD